MTEEERGARVPVSVRLRLASGFRVPVAYRHWAVREIGSEGWPVRFGLTRTVAMLPAGILSWVTVDLLSGARSTPLLLPLSVFALTFAVLSVVIGAAWPGFVRQVMLRYQLRERSRRRWLVGNTVAVVVVVAALFVLGSRGRWVEVRAFDSGELRARAEAGTTSEGAEGPFTLTGRSARLTWSLNAGVDRVSVAVEEQGEGRVEFSSSARQGTWDLSALPAGEYWVRHSWSTLGTQTGRWNFQVAERVPWWARR